MKAFDLTSRWTYTGQMGASFCKINTTFQVVKTVYKVDAKIVEYFKGYLQTANYQNQIISL